MFTEEREKRKPGRRKRTWVRLDCQGVLHGSINFIYKLEQQAVFLKMIAMAATYGNTPGVISDNSGNPLPHDFIAHELHCPIDVFESVLKIGIKENSLCENAHGIELINFKKYQFTEYDRQRPYREAKQARFVPMHCTACGYRQKIDGNRTGTIYCPICEQDNKLSEMEFDKEAKE